MMPTVTATPLPGVVLIEPKVYGDPRGYFLECWNRVRYAEAGLPTTFVQDNLSLSRRGVVRGLHYQHPAGQGKLVSVLQGEVFDVAVDLRVGSPSFGRWFGTVLSETNHRQVYIPPGFGHGFAVVSESALFFYKCTEFYRPEDEGSVLWNDPDLRIDWPIESAELSAKDAAAPRLKDIEPSRLPRYAPA